MLCFIVNEHSRSGKGAKIWKEAEAVLKKKNIAYESYVTQYEGHAFSREMLLSVLNDAATDACVSCRIALEIHQPFDHPALSSVPETDYLKGFVLGVRDQ